MLSTRESAEYLGVGPTKFKELGIPPKRIGTRILYDVIDLDQFADDLTYFLEETESRQDNPESRADEAFGIASPFQR